MLGKKKEMVEMIEKYSVAKLFKMNKSVAVILPKEVRAEAPGLEPGAHVKIFVDEGRVILEPLK